MFRLFFIFLTGLLLSFSACAKESPFKEGEQYIRFPQPLSVSTGKIEVLEFFSYGCPHCYAFEPFFQKWKKTVPAGVEVKQVPSIMGGRTGTLIAKAHYAAKRLGVLDKFHPALFEAIQVKHLPMNTQEQIVALVKELGIDEKAFLEEMNSFVVDTQIRKVTQLMMEYRISGVPSVAINGRYLTSGGMAGDFGKMIKVMDYLVDKEVQARDAKRAAKAAAKKASSN